MVNKIVVVGYECLIIGMVTPSPPFQDGIGDLILMHQSKASATWLPFIDSIIIKIYMPVRGFFFHWVFPSAYPGPQLERI
ncbi:hypothetical protein ES703_125049 [subsurface metagenome]